MSAQRNGSEGSCPRAPADGPPGT